MYLFRFSVGLVHHTNLSGFSWYMLKNLIDASISFGLSFLFNKDLNIELLGEKYQDPFLGVFPRPTGLRYV